MTYTSQKKSKGHILNILAVVLGCVFLGVLSCGAPASQIIKPPPPDRPWRALEKTCHICLETESFNCPIDSVRKTVMGCISIAESLENCGADLRACGKTATIDKAEMQGRVNAESARADANARIAWYVAGGGVVLSIITFLVGAFAL